MDDRLRSGKTVFVSTGCQFRNYLNFGVSKYNGYMASTSTSNPFRSKNIAHDSVDQARSAREPIKATGINFQIAKEDFRLRVLRT